jgi:hypothetical protein
MSGIPEIDLQSLAADWHASDVSATPADQVHAFVQRRTRLLVIWTTVDAVVGFGFLTFLVHRAATHPDPIEKLAMSLLAAIAAGAMIFVWWNWHGAIRASAENTATFIALAAERSRRFARAVRAGWVILSLQIAVFTPWIYYRLHGNGSVPTPSQELFGWGFLAAMVATAGAAIIGVQRWARRDAIAFQRIRGELEE